jgi:hypothetical protein
VKQVNDEIEGIFFVFSFLFSIERRAEERAWQIRMRGQRRRSVVLAGRRQRSRERLAAMRQELLSSTTTRRTNASIFLFFFFQRFAVKWWGNFGDFFF